MVDEGFVTVGSIIGSRIYGCSSESGGEVCYRSPASNEDNNNKLLPMLENTIKGGKATRFLVMRDFNCPNINFRDGYVSAGPTSLDHKLFNKVQDLLLVENILQETHFNCL